MKLASFDIFDTALIRKCGAAENIFYLLARKLYPEDAALREAFLLWRRTTPAKLKPDLGKVEVSLENLYSGASYAGFTQYSADWLIGKELETESENLIVNSSIRELISEGAASLIFNILYSWRSLCASRSPADSRISIYWLAFSTCPD